MDSEKIMKGWEVIVYNPNDYEKPEDEREVLLESRYKTIRQAHEEIERILKPYDMKVSYSTMRKMGDKSYKGGSSKLVSYIRFNKCKFLVKTYLEICVKEET